MARAKQKGWPLGLTILVAGVIWMSLRKRKQKLQVITTKNRVFMLDDAADYYKLGLPRDESVKSMQWIPVG